MKNSGPNNHPQNPRRGPAKRAVVSEAGANRATVAEIGSRRKSSTRTQQEDRENSLESLKQLVNLEELEASIKQSPDINASRVVNLHHRIEAGEYEIDSTRLAEKLLAFESELDKPPKATD